MYSAMSLSSTQSALAGIRTALFRRACFVVNAEPPSRQSQGVIVARTTWPDAGIPLLDGHCRNALRVSVPCIFVYFVHFVSVCPGYLTQQCTAVTPFLQVRHDVDVSYSFKEENR